MDPEVAADPPLLVADCENNRLDRNLGSVSALHRDFPAPAAVLGQLPPAVNTLLVALGQPPERRGLPDGLLSPPAVHLSRALIPGRNTPISVPRHDRILGVIQQRTEIRQLIC